MMMSNGNSLVYGASFMKATVTMMYCYFSITLLCFNVMFDLFIIALPSYLLMIPNFIPKTTYTRYMTSLINYTTPIVFSIPMIFSGTKIYCDNPELLIASKAKNSLLLSNHGSRIDWMVGMFVGYTKEMCGIACNRTRVGFVCEFLIQYMPFIGWYRKIICDDIFVKRSFLQDAEFIQKNIYDFSQSDEKRMLFLSPEGVIVDYGKEDMDYAKNCRDYCVSEGYDPFAFVLTPRYKGSSCLLDQVNDGGPIVSICVAFVRDNKLLNCQITSRHRIIPDIYHLIQGISGYPVDIYINLKQLHFTAKDCKKVLMDDYKRKDILLAKWNRHLKKENLRNKLMSEYFPVRVNVNDAIVSHVLHALSIYIFSYTFGINAQMMTLFIWLFILVSTSHLFGWMMNSTSMESVPFETGIKALLRCIKDKV